MLILMLHKTGDELFLCLLAEYDTYDDDVEVVPVPVPVAWLEWGPWSSAACSAPGGQMVRVRSCAGALPCVDGFPQEQKPCGTVYTAKKQYRKFETKIPRKEIARPQSQFPHSCVLLERF
jgi:hypothetical protein